MPHGWTDLRYAMTPPPWAKPYSFDAFQQPSESSSSSSDSGSESEDKKSKMLGLHSGVLGFGAIGWKEGLGAGLDQGLIVGRGGPWSWTGSVVKVWPSFISQVT